MLDMDNLENKRELVKESLLTLNVWRAGKKCKK